MQYSIDKHQEFVDVVRRFDGRIADYVAEVMSGSGIYLVEAIEGCESPIEQLMAMALRKASEAFEERFGGNGILAVDPQMSVETSIGKLRVDFMLRWVDFGAANKLATRVIVECDGYAFHDGDKEQAQRDKQRDRALKEAGFTVLRFAGGEIWADPDKCAREAWRQLLVEYRAKKLAAAS